MAIWIILGIVYAVGLLGLRRLGGFGSAAEALRDWGCATSETCLLEPVSR